MTTPKDKYRALCLHEASIPLFARDWWLDATAGPHGWDVAIAEKGGQVAAALPYSRRTRFGLRLLGQPALTPALGPWFAPGRHRNADAAASDAGFLSAQKECMEAMIAQLPPYDHFAQSWHHRVTNWLPFYWEGYTQTTRYTYTIALSPGMDVLGGFASNMRNKVRKAQRLVRVIDDCSLERFYELNRKTFFRQRLDMPYRFDYVQRFDTELAARRQRRIFAAIDAQERFHSALYLCWDDEVGYVHMVGEDPELRQSGAGILLIHDAIRHCAQAGLKLFDFVGSMIKGVEIVRRSCGGMQTAYFHVSRTPSRLLLARQGMLSLLRGK